MPATDDLLPMPDVKSAPPRARAPRVLVADDQADVLEALRLLLKSEGYELETASSPVANNVTLLAEAVVLNYMALHDDVGRFAAALPSQGLGANVNNLVAFAPIRPTPT